MTIHIEPCEKCPFYDAEMCLHPTGRGAEDARCSYSIPDRPGYCWYQSDNVCFPKVVTVVEHGNDNLAIIMGHWDYSGNVATVEWHNEQPGARWFGPIKSPWEKR